MNNITNMINKIPKLQMNKIQKTPPLVKLDSEKTIKFKDQFNKLKSEDVKEKLEDLYSKITEKADRLSDKLYIQDMIEYKKLVKEFMDVAVTNSYMFEKDNFLDRRGRHRVFTKVKKVDKALSELTNEFLSGEVDRINVVKRLDDIKGMLMDMFM
ncbi:MAG: YaaR family protein [Anaeromicrobium sp.]|uniref:YaaR family protein n=1 Tax=Anaeromicrobium sp. TaxID=1929132 RepID=UPI0025D2E1CF|nr:YaaR family protein [Anaeromicrobium sp.]MCT4592700.1 YaaR family protein [Anaeromicrobium sp.]